MALPGISRRQAIFGGIVLGFLWMWISFDRPTSISAPRIWGIYSGGREPKLVNHDIDIFDFPALNSWVIRDICETTEWNSSLVFTCDNNHGGVGHVRNSILNCVRYAIAAGGSLVLPQIALREDPVWNIMEQAHSHKHKRHGPGRKGMEYMFDKEHFIHSLRHSCPELKLINDLEQSTGGRRRALLPESLETNHPVTGLEHPDEWRHRLHQWIAGIMPQAQSTTPKDTRIVIDLEQSFLSYPTHSDGHRFAHTFGRIMKFRPDTRRLATKVLLQFAYWYDMRLNVTQDLMTPSFLAAHLKTEDPLLEMRDLEGRHGGITYARYEAQAETYLGVARALNLSVMYVASGNMSEIHRLMAEGASGAAGEAKVDITHKEDLLKGEDLEELERLKWDQRALVDWLVATKAQEFVGVGHSSFSWNVVLQRHEFAPGKGRLEGNQPDGIWGDGVSGLFGVRRGYVDSSKCMWP